MDSLMKILKLFTYTLSAMFLILSACGQALPEQLPDLPFVVTLTPDAQMSEYPTNLPGLVQATEPVAQPTPTITSTTAPASASPLPTEPSFTPTDQATYIPYIPTATETLLPPLELPTEKSREPALAEWTGLPTYPGDSEPGLLFRVDYDPKKWAQTAGNYGEIVLANRVIEYCTLSPWTGRGLPVDWKVTHEIRVIGSATYEINSVSAQDVLKFVSYVGGDKRVLTGFQVSFEQGSEQCLSDAETVLGTLRSFSAIPTFTPSP
jgi:hypothetical protein